MKYLNFEDVRLVPRTPSHVYSRKIVDTSQNLGGIHFTLPAIIPPMTGLVNEATVKIANDLGIIAIRPRGHAYSCVAANSSLDSALAVAAEMDELEGILCLEIANGHLSILGDTIRDIRRAYPALEIWSGTVCTADGVEFLREAGADAVLVGIGVGSACSTTWKTGVGLPMFGTIEECCEEGIPIISAGGLKTPGDFCKALAAGASACMIGNLLRGCEDVASPNLYYGMASDYVKDDGEFIEGALQEVESSGETIAGVLKTLDEGLRSAMSYCDALNLTEFRGNAQFEEV